MGPRQELASASVDVGMNEYHHRETYVREGSQAFSSLQNARTRVGLTLGSDDGDADGLLVGTEDGAAEGEDVGPPDELLEGALVGRHRRGGARSNTRGRRVGVALPQRGGCLVVMGATIGSTCLVLGKRAG